MNVDTSTINPLENEAIYIFREVAAQFENPVLLFSGGKDSITLVRLAQKAFYPCSSPLEIFTVSESGAPCNSHNVKFKLMMFFF